MVKTMEVYFFPSSWMLDLSVDDLKIQDSSSIILIFYSVNELMHEFCFSHRS